MNKIRIHYKSLIETHGLLTLNGAPYTGLAYRFSNDGIFEALYDIRGGVILEESSDLLPILNKDFPRIDEDYLEYDDCYYYVTYQGKDFNGIAYLFESDQTGAFYLMSESQFLNSTKQRLRREWYFNGQLESQFEKYIYQIWYENGELKTKRERRTKDDSLKIKFNENQALEYIEIYGEISFAHEKLKTYNLPEKFKIEGNSITEKSLEHLRKNKNFNNITHLIISLTKLPDDVLLAYDFSGLNNLELIYNHNVSLETVKVLKARYPDCTITYIHDLDAKKYTL